MAYSVKYTGESHQLGDSAKHFVIIYADTAADMPEPDPAWAAGSELIVMEDGGAKYRLNNAGEWVESSFDAGGGGNGDTAGNLELKTLESGLQYVPVNLSGQYNTGKPIVGHDGFYIAMGYGNIRKVSFVDSSAEDFAIVCQERPMCWLTHLGYGNGVYIGVDTHNGIVCRSEDCVNWIIIGDVQIAPTEVTGISFSGGDFFLATSSGAIGACLQSEDYRRIADHSNYYMDVTEAGNLQAVYGHCGSHFFVTDTCIVSGHPGGGEFRRLAFLEEAPDDQYLASTVAFWNNHLVIFTDDYQLIYAIPMRYPHDTGGNFLDPEWRFFRDGNWQMELEPRGVCAYGDNLIVFTMHHVFCIDRNGEITQLTENEVNFDAVLSVHAAENALLVCVNVNQAYQFFIK